MTIAKSVYIPIDWKRAQIEISRIFLDHTYWIDRSARDYWETIRIPATSINTASGGA